MPIKVIDDGKAGDRQAIFCDGCGREIERGSDGKYHWLNPVSEGAPPRSTSATSGAVRRSTTRSTRPTASSCPTSSSSSGITSAATTGNAFVTISR
jgi:hypothetical protein